MQYLLFVCIRSEYCGIIYKQNIYKAEAWCYRILYIGIIPLILDEGCFKTENFLLFIIVFNIVFSISWWADILAKDYLTPGLCCNNIHFMYFVLWYHQCSGTTSGSLLGLSHVVLSRFFKMNEIFKGMNQCQLHARKVP